MADFVMHCPFCEEELEVQEEWIGMTGECPGCGKSFPIAKDAPESAPAAPAAPSGSAMPQLQPVPPVPAPAGGAMPQLQPIQPGMNPGAMPYGQQPMPQSAMPYGQQPQLGMYSQPYAPPPWTLTAAEARMIESDTMWYWLGMIIGMVTCGIGAIISIVCLLRLLYRYWRLVPPQEAETTPGKAIGFLFIPFFNIYWQFVAFWKLSLHYDRFAPYGQKPSNLALWMLICNFIPYVGVLGSLVLGIMWMQQMKNIALTFPRIG